MANEPMKEKASAAAMREEEAGSSSVASLIERLTLVSSEVRPGKWGVRFVGGQEDDPCVHIEGGDDLFLCNPEDIPEAVFACEAVNALPALLHYALRGIEAEEWEAGCEGCSLGGRDCEWVRLERGKACCEGCTHAAMSERRSR